MATTLTMMTAELQRGADIGSKDRFGLTLFLAIVFHAIIILGVTFSPTLLNPESLKPPPLEITLVHQKSEQKPSKADYLAQADLEGGGNSQEMERPTSPVTTLVTAPSKGVASAVSLPAAPPEAQQPADTKVLTSDSSRQKIQPTEEVNEQQKKALAAAEVVQLNMQIATLSAEIDQSMHAYSEQLRHRYVSANTKSYRDAAYLDAWRAKVERIGNLNYPEEAKKRNLSGSLVLDVALKPDGTIFHITVRRSSGQKVLDDAAVRIVKLAAPFSPFPQDLRKDTDILHIIRSWQFIDSHFNTSHGMSPGR